MIEQRAARGVFDARPGLTGLAQIQELICQHLSYSQRPMRRCLRALMSVVTSFTFFSLFGERSGDRVRESRYDRESILVILC